MSMGPHASHHLGRRTIEIEQYITAVVLLGVGHDIHVISLAVALPEKAHHRSMHQLPCRPKPFSRTRLLCGVVNQTDQEQIMRHGRQLAADSLPSQKESAVEHGGENATEAPRRYNHFSANGNKPLNSVSQPRGSFHNPLLLDPTPLWQPPSHFPAASSFNWLMIAPPSVFRYGP